MEEKNQGTNEYTGEYGNVVENGDAPESSVYSYSYKEQPSEATRSGDYHREESVETVGEENYSENQQMQQSSSHQTEEMHRQSQPQQTEGMSSQSQPQQTEDINWQYQNCQPQNDWNNFSGDTVQSNPNNQKERSDRKDVKEGLTLKKLGVCAALAAVFGLVAAVCFTAGNYFSEKVLGINQNAKNVEVSETTDDVVYEKKEPAQGSVDAMDVSDIASNTMPAIVAITSTQEGQTYYDFFGQQHQGEDIPSSGSGFIIGKNETELLIATNNHVIEGAKTISVQFIDEEVYEAKTKGTDSAADLAVIAVKLTNIKDSTLKSIKIATLGDSSEAKVGEMVVAIGNALGYGQSVTVGYISAKDREIAATTDDGGASNTINVIQTDAAINPGNSGGALLNMQGEVIGINSAKIADSTVEGMGYAIPISEATPIIDELKTKEVLTDEEKGYLGISGQTVSEQMTTYNMPEGVFVSEVAEGGAADKAGILSGDIITAINDVPVTNIISLQEKVNTYKKGTKISVTYKRSSDGIYKEDKVEVTLQGQSSLDNLEDESSAYGESSQEDDSQNGDSQEKDSQEKDSQGEGVPEEGDNGYGNNEEYDFNDFFNDVFPFGW